MMTLLARGISIAAGLGLFFVVSFLVRRRRIYTLYAVSWFIFCLMFLVTGIFGRFTETLATILGVYYPPTAILVLALGCLLVTVMHLSMIVTQQHKDIKRLEKEMALLRILPPGQEEEKRGQFI